MGRRKSRRRRVVRPKKTLPKVFQCPRCGQASVWVTIKREMTKDGVIKTVVVKCNKCGLMSTYDYSEHLHPVDYYSKFVDDYVEKIEIS